MDVRSATSTETGRIRDIAEQSFQTSYSLSPGQRRVTVENAFADGTLSEWVDGDGGWLSVVTDGDGGWLSVVTDGDGEWLSDVTDGDDVIGFADVGVDEYAVLRWLYVDPARRGRGAGTALFDHVQAEAEGRDLALVGRILAEHDEGGTFCEQFGFEQRGKTKLDFGDETFVGDVHPPPDAFGVGVDERPSEIPESLTVDGTTVLVAAHDETPWTDGPFFRSDDASSGDSYGYYCSNCGSADDWADSLGRLECQNCGNKHLANSWDGADL